MIRFMILISVLSVCAFCQSPGWRAGASVPSPRGTDTASPPAVPAVQFVRQQARTVRVIDTVRVVDTVEVVRVDTVRPPKPLFYDYAVWYEVLDKQMSMQANFEWAWERTAQKTMLQSSDTTLLSLGNESLREIGYSYDERGNKLVTMEKVIEGLDMRVGGTSVSITYRVGSSLLTLRGEFDRHGLLQLTSDFSRRRYLFNFVPLEFLAATKKYTLFLRIEKKEVVQ